MARFYKRRFSYRRRPYRRSFASFRRRYSTRKRVYRRRVK